MVKGRTALRLPMVLVLRLANLKLAEEPSISPLLSRPCVLVLSWRELSSMEACERVVAEAAMVGNSHGKMSSPKVKEWALHGSEV